jgi:hypothetical protein
MPDFRIDTTTPRVSPGAAGLDSLPWHVSRIEQPTGEASAPSTSDEPLWKRAMREAAAVVPAVEVLAEADLRKSATPGTAAAAATYARRALVNCSFPQTQNGQASVDAWLISAQSDVSERVKTSVDHPSPPNVWKACNITMNYPLSQANSESRHAGR